MLSLLVQYLGFIYLVGYRRLCEIVESDILYLYSSLGLIKIKDTINVKIFPNPAKTIINVKDLTPNLYILNVTTEQNQQVAVKIMKE